MKKKIYITLLLGLFFLACVFVSFSFLVAFPRKHFSEKPAIPKITTENSVFANLNQISLDNIRNLQEIFVLPQTELGMVVVLAETQGNAIQAIYNNGMYYRWDLVTSKVLAKRTVFAVPNTEMVQEYYRINKLNAVMGFNESGSLMITPNKILFDGTYGFNVWQTDTAELLYCFGDGEGCIVDQTTYSSLLLHPTRDLFFHLWEDEGWDSGSLGGSYGFVNQKGHQGIFNLERFDPGEPQIVRVAIDPLGDYLAFVNDENDVVINDVSRYQNPFPQEELYGPTYRANYTSGNSLAENITIDLNFDPTHSWLSWLTDKNLVIWSLRNYIFPLSMKTELKGANVMSFDRTGKILVVATQDGIKIFDLAEKKQVTEYQVGEVTALYFTRDNRLLIWGDAQGAVHLWGVK